MADKGLLIVFSGPSGVGKDTVLDLFLAQSADCARSISMTTRPARAGEQDGADYYFVSRELFGEHAAGGRLLEYAEYNGNYYGTPRQGVEQLRAKGLHVLLKIEVQGARKVRELCPDATFIFLMPPSWQELKARLSGRGTEAGEHLRQRLEIAKEEMRHAGEYDYIIVNDTVEDCMGRLRAIITAEACKAVNKIEFIEEVLSNA